MRPLKGVCSIDRGPGTSLVMVVVTSLRPVGVTRMFPPI